MDVKYCLKCDSILMYNRQFDSYFCNKCDTWAEYKCEDVGCEYCNKRPPKPSDTMI